MQSSPAICVVGSINMDLVFRTPRMPGVGETISGHEFVQIAGGKGANQAVAAARQGAAVSFIGCIGNDAYGAQALAVLQHDGINTDYITTIPNCATGVAGIFVDDKGSNSIVVAPGANALLTSSHIEASRAAIRSAQILIFQCETPLETIQTAITVANEHGVKVVFNPAPAIPLPDGLLAKVSHLIVNETEACQLSGITVTDIESAKAASHQLLNLDVHCVLLTMGHAGVCVTLKNHFQHLPGIVVDVVDTTAAGDTFVGAFAVALAQGMNETQAATEAQFSAALTVTKLGAQSSIPQRAEVELLKNQQRRSHGQT